MSILERIDYIRWHPASDYSLPNGKGTPLTVIMKEALASLHKSLQYSTLMEN